MLAVGVPLATLTAMTACSAADYVQPGPPPVTLRSGVAPLPPPAQRLAPNDGSAPDSHAPPAARKAVATALGAVALAMLAIA